MRVIKLKSIFKIFEYTIRIEIQMENNLILLRNLIKTIRNKYIVVFSCT